MNYYETHAHYHHAKLKNKLENLLPRLEKADIKKIIEVPISLESNYEIQYLREYVDKLGYSHMFRYAVGVHPNNITWESYKDDLVEEMLQQFIIEDLNGVVAVGETGLDYYRCIDDKERERQKVFFQIQIEMALDYRLPLILHIRDAHEHALQILDEYHKRHPYLHGVCHCFTGDYELAMEYISKGFLIGIGGVITRQDVIALRECVKKIDLRHIVLETDSPYLKPTEVKGKVNTSLNLDVICKCIAHLKGVDKERVEQVTYENAFRLFEKNA